MQINSQFQLQYLFVGAGVGVRVGSLVAQRVKNLPTMQEMWVWFLDWEDPMEKGMATHSSILAWRTPWTEKPGWLQSMGLHRVRYDWATKHIRSNSVFRLRSLPGHSKCPSAPGYRTSGQHPWMLNQELESSQGYTPLILHGGWFCPQVTLGNVRGHLIGSTWGRGLLLLPSS